MARRLAFAGFACIVCVASGACGGPAGPLPSPKTAADDPLARVAAFEQLEDEVLRDLAAIDARIARRARIVPRDEDLRRIAMAAVLAEDASVAVVDGAIDPFSFDARARGLDAVRQRLSSAPKSLLLAVPGPARANPALEAELLVRLVDAEAARLTTERQLPRSASALVRAVADAWTLARTPRQAEERDRWLARRVGEMHASLSEAPLDTVRARELDDTLDALEHAMDAPGYAKATRELVRLREALEGQSARPSGPVRSDWSEVAPGLFAHLGVAGSPDAIDRALASAEVRLRDQIEGLEERAGLLPKELAKVVAPLMFESTPCLDAIPGSPLRSMNAPPERTAGCHLRHAYEAAPTDAALAATLVAMHDHVIVARWAVAVASGASTLAEAQAKHRPAALHGPEVTARLERIASAHPVVAIGAGLAAAMLTPTRTHRVAALWSGLGDVPYDILEHELKLAPIVVEYQAK